MLSEIFILSESVLCICLNGLPVKDKSIVMLKFLFSLT